METYPEFLVYFVVVGLEGGQLAFDLALGGGQVDVDSGQFVDASVVLFYDLFGGALGTGGLRAERS